MSRCRHRFICQYMALTDFSRDDLSHFIFFDIHSFLPKIIDLLFEFVFKVIIQSIILPKPIYIEAKYMLYGVIYANPDHMGVIHNYKRFDTFYYFSCFFGIIRWLRFRKYIMWHVDDVFIVPTQCVFQ